MKCCLVFLAQFWCLAQVFLLHAAPLRVATWDLQPIAAAGANGLSTDFQHGLVREAAKSLKELHPDVILLQHVAGWETCRQLADELRPENYKVLTCSSWRDPAATNFSSQVAILSKANAYLSWSESWQHDGESRSSDGGFAFAAVRVGDKSIGIFSIQLGTNSGLPKTQFARQIASLQNWKVNRPQGYFLTVDSNAALGRLGLEQLGFEIVPQPKDKRAATSSLFARNISIVSSQIIAHTSNFEHDALICEMDLTPAKAVLPLPTLAKSNAPHQPLARAIPTDKSGSRRSLRTILWLSGCLAGGLAFLFLVRQLARRSGIQTTPALSLSNARIAITSASENPSQMNTELGSSASPNQPQTWGPTQMDAVVRAGLIANMSRWLKQKVIRQLVSDRAQLMAMQEVAASKMQAVDERLANVERQIQQRNRDYEQRIDHLLKSLVKAKEENRQLIRAQIAHLKAEIEKAERRPGGRSNYPVEF